MTDQFGGKEEIGEELLEPQLILNTVYVLQAIHRPKQAATFWYVGRMGKFAGFAAKAIHSYLMLRVNDKGQFFDNLNHRIKVHKYLGEV